MNISKLNDSRDTNYEFVDRMRSRAYMRISSLYRIKNL